MTIKDQTQYRTNAQGHLVPENTIEPIDLLRDDTVRQIIAKAQVLQGQMKAYKADAMLDIKTFLDISANQYGIKMGGQKGNITLTSYDGETKVIVSVSDTLSFDERLQIAKQLVDKCILTWAKDANSNIQALVQHAFQTDKQGKISTARIFGLMRLKIDDEQWQTAMKALKDSIKIDSSCEYLRLYKKVRDDNGNERYQQIALDIAGL